ncbi:MAG: magnesium/cobalt transporter CorA [Deinococcales bacterium]
MKDCKLGLSWLNVNGVHDTGLLEKLGDYFGLHLLTLEDIANINQRPKVEFYDEYVFFCLRMLSVSPEGELENEQLSLILFKDMVLSCQENQGDVFDPVRDRLRKQGRVRRFGSDYLAYSLLDMVVDNYFKVLEHYSDSIDTLEDGILLEPTPQTPEHINALKRDLYTIRKALWPLRDFLANLEREESPLLSDHVLTFMRDVQDHCMQALDAVETLREVLASMHDLYLSKLSFKMNEIMKVLTIISTIFIPLSFVAGIYGMNFDHMPELHWRYGYGLFWLLIVILISSMFIYFWRKRWF